MLLGLVLIPTIAGLLAFAIRSDGVRRGLLCATAVLHVGLTVASWVTPPEPLLGGWFALDAVGRVFLGITSVLFLAVAVYGLVPCRAAPAAVSSPSTAWRAAAEPSTVRALWCPSSFCSSPRPTPFSVGPRQPPANGETVAREPFHQRQALHRRPEPAERCDGPRDDGRSLDEVVHAERG